MGRTMLSAVLLAGLMAGQGGCASAAETTQGAAAKKVPDLSYEGIETHMLQDDLVEFRLAIGGGADAAALNAYADCAVAQYAQIRGFGYARPVRVLLDRSGRMLRGNAAYLLSRDRPEGRRVIAAEPTLSACRAGRIPTV